MLIHRLHWLLRLVATQHQGACLLQWCLLTLLILHPFLCILKGVCWYHWDFMISKHNCVVPFMLFYVMSILLVSVMRYEFLCIWWLKISPALLLKIMIVHSHFNFTFFLLTACIIVQLFAIVEKFVWSVDWGRIVISQCKMMTSQVL